MGENYDGSIDVSIKVPDNVMDKYGLLQDEKDAEEAKRIVKKPKLVLDKEI